MTHSPGEAFAHAAAQGIDLEAFPATVHSALFQSPFYAALATKNGQWANIAWSGGGLRYLRASGQALR
ncbi:MAG: hypothetical protein ABSC88_11780 [Terracidiphilus sp.]